MSGMRHAAFLSMQDQKQKKVQELALAHADLVEERGYWVDLLDLALLAEVRGKQLKFVIYNGSSPLKLLSAVDYFQGVSPTFAARVSPSAPLWIVVLYNVKYVATDDSKQLNHFVPAWGHDIAGFENLWQSSVSSAEKEVRDGNQPACPKCGQASGDIDVVDKIKHVEAAEKHQTALRKVQFVKDLKADLRLVAQDVPADGDCALWSVALADAGPSSSMAFVEGWRERLAHAWRKFALQGSSGPLACFGDIVLCLPWENVEIQGQALYVTPRSSCCLNLVFLGVCADSETLSGVSPSKSSGTASAPLPFAFLAGVTIGFEASAKHASCPSTGPVSQLFLSKARPADAKLLPSHNAFSWLDNSFENCSMS